METTTNSAKLNYAFFEKDFTEREITDQLRAGSLQAKCYKCGAANLCSPAEETFSCSSCKSIQYIPTLNDQELKKKRAF